MKPWKLSGEGHREFPDGHALITTDLISSIREIFGEAGMDRIIESRTETCRQQYQEAMQVCESAEEKITELVKLRSQEGYMAAYQAQANGDFLFIENHCPICVAAEACQGFCRSELDVFRSLFEGQALVERSEHLVSGARRCAYRISPCS